jgi:uncharacterized protein (TIGR02246 family)
MMRSFVATLFAAVVCSGALGQQPTVTASDDEAAIRAAIASYVDAYNRGDAQAVAEHWSDGGEWVTPNGDRVSGREAIEKAMGEVFAESKDTKIEVVEPRIRFVTPDVAIEEGGVSVTSPGEPTTKAAYIAVHVKRDGAWKLNTVRETELPETASVAEELAALNWMVGDWVDSNDEGTTETSIQWTKNNAFLTGTFRVSAPGMEDLEGTLLIGWDPEAGAIHSWMFDFDGGFGEGVWTRDGNRWIVDFSQVLPDGRRGSCSNVYTLIDADRYTWQSVNREVDGEALPDAGEVIVARKQAAAPAVAQTSE